MPDSRRHRGPHPQDRAYFHQDHWPTLRESVADFSWLLTRSYSSRAALKLVGDHFQLTDRQRLAVLRSSCSDQALTRRAQSRVGSDALRGAAIWIDGFNVLTTVEAALGNGVLLLGRDGCLRDMCSLHGSYRAVEETLPAAQHIGQILHDVLGCTHVHWCLDRPVSNSGRLGSMLRQLAESRGWTWEVRLEVRPDAVLCGLDEIVATSDAAILDQCRHWYNLARHVVTAVGSDQAVIVPLDVADTGNEETEVPPCNGSVMENRSIK